MNIFLKGILFVKVFSAKFLQISIKSEFPESVEEMLFYIGMDSFRSSKGRSTLKDKITFINHFMLQDLVLFKLKVKVIVIHLYLRIMIKTDPLATK